ncbi:MAG: hypothetical protein U0694_13080 [Anaerolineae bacterium]
MFRAHQHHWSFIGGFRLPAHREAAPEEDVGETANPHPGCACELVGTVTSTVMMPS